MCHASAFQSRDCHQSHVCVVCACLNVGELPRFDNQPQHLAALFLHLVDLVRRGTSAGESARAHRDDDPTADYADKPLTIKLFSPTLSLAPAFALFVCFVGGRVRIYPLNTPKDAKTKKETIGEEPGAREESSEAAMNLRDSIADVVD